MQYYIKIPDNDRMKHDKELINHIACECLLGRARIFNRVLTGIYDDELRSFGLKATQLNLLVVIAKAGPIRRIDIGKRLSLDPSTLTRNLKVMLSNGWIEETANGEDARGLPLQIAGQGRDLLNQIGPAWRKAQSRAQKLVGEDGAAFLLKLSANMIDEPPE